jgi:hypothetical protein
MSSLLPLSLSPHVVVLASADLVSLLEENKLPPLHDLLRAFTPLESSGYIFAAHQTVFLTDFYASIDTHDSACYCYT